MKYLILKQDGFETPHLFPSHRMHKRVADGLTADGGKIVAAGFVTIRGRKPDDGSDDTLAVYAYGHSEGLKIESRGDVDAALIQDALNLPEI